MGYDIIAIIGEHDDTWPNGSDMNNWVSNICSIDLKKIGDGAIASLSSDKKYQKPGCYFYSNDGNTRIYTDRNSDNLIRIVPIREVLKAVRNDCKKDNYRRFQLFKAMLETMVQGRQWLAGSSTGRLSDRLVVVFYGH